MRLEAIISGACVYLFIMFTIRYCLANIMEYKSTPVTKMAIILAWTIFVLFISIAIHFRNIHLLLIGSITPLLLVLFACWYLSYNNKK